MAGARAAASLSLTIAVACATLLVVGGILVGPTILECSQKPGSVMACVDEKFARWQGSSEAQSSLVPQIASSSSSVALSAPLFVEGANKPGWIDARATEFESPHASVVEAPKSSAERASSAASMAASVLDDRASEAPAGTGPAVDVADVDPLTPLARIPQALLTTSMIAPQRPWASLDPKPQVRPAPSLASAPPITGSISPSPLDTIVEPPPMPRPAIEAAPPAVELTPSPQSSPLPAPPEKLATVKRPKPPTFRNDPRFPNVVVLPPPNSGSGSSFVVLGPH